MRLVAAEEAAQVERLGHRVLVGRHGRAEGEVAQGLEGVVEFVEPGVAGRPPGVALCERLGPGGRKAEQPVAAIPHHVDRQVVAGEHVKPGPHPVADGQPLPFEPARERGMFGPEAVGDLHEVGIGLE
ncbi:MAG: hypothetical protein EBX35_07780 [Planctomycetia bacterium]|nr:hypothetical protein [Planctomycetia bacterium]